MFHTLDAHLLPEPNGTGTGSLSNPPDKPTFRFFF